MSHEKFAPVGSLVLSGYWGTVDQVLEHVEGQFGSSVRVITVEHPAQRTAPDAFSLSRERVHCTPFDPKRDRVVGTVA